MDFSDKVVVVTGAASGLGEDAARSFAAAGARVLVVDVDAAAVRAVASDIGGDSLAVPCDVTDLEQVDDALAVAVEAFGGIDVVVNNAGVCLLAPLPEMDSEEFRRMLDVNLLGTFHGIRAGVPHLVARGGGAIVNVASTAGLNGAPLIGGYGATKAGVISLTKTAAAELRTVGVRVNCVCPGFVRTPMSDGLSAGFEAASGQPADAFFAGKQGRLGEPQDISRVILHLADDAGAWVTGSVYVADGGLTAALM